MGTEFRSLEDKPPGIGEYVEILVAGYAVPVHHESDGCGGTIFDDVHPGWWTPDDAQEWQPDATTMRYMREEVWR